jgi:DNA repair protein RadC
MEDNSLKSWADEDKPREKLLLKGKSTLSEAELIAILLRSGTHEEHVVRLSQKVLSKVNNDLNELGKLSVKDMLDWKLKGLGETKAITIVAALELGRRKQQTEIKQRKIVSGSKDMYELLSPLIADLRHEEFWIVLLNRANKIISVEPISSGGITGTVVDTRILFSSALKSNAISIILSHNHPSGSLRPSAADEELTRKIRDAGKLLDVQLLDHLIISESGYYSFADEGKI